MSEPNVHTSIRVYLDGRNWHVDVGYAAPFREPIPLDRLPWAITFGRDRHVLDFPANERQAPEGGGLDRSETAHRYEMTHYTDGERRHGYVVHGPPRRYSFFYPTIVKSFSRDWTFMQNLRITRFLENGGALELRNRMFLEIHGAPEAEVGLTIEGRPDIGTSEAGGRLPGARVTGSVLTGTTPASPSPAATCVTERRLASLDELVSVVRDRFEMPRCRVEEAVAVLERFTGRPFFCVDGSETRIE